MKNKVEKAIVGIDLGGTNLRIGLVDENNKIQYQNIISSRGLSEVSDAAKEVENIIAQYMSENSVEEIAAISIGVPSSVAKDKETVICTTNIRNS